MSVTSGESVYRNLLEEKGYKLALFNKKIKMKSPDFKVFFNEELLFYCEVKDIEDLDDKYFQEDLEIPDEITIILNKIREANKQFKSVNPNHAFPNVLAFHCKRIGMDANDLHDTILGYIDYSDGHKLYRRHRGPIENRLSEESIIIDTYIFHHDGIDQYSCIYITSDGFYGETIHKLNLLEFKNPWGEKEDNN